MPFALAAAVLLLDQATKLGALDGLASRSPVALIPSLLTLRLRYNTGAAFGLMGGSSLLLVVLAVLVIVLLVTFGHRTALHCRPLLVGIALQIGGAAGNLVDRVRLGHVVDFIDVRLTPTYTWPTFNVADMAICCGAGLMAYVLFTGQAEERPAAPDTPAPAGDRQ